MQVAQRELDVDAVDVHGEDRGAVVHATGASVFGEVVGQVCVHPRSITACRRFPHRLFELRQRRRGPVAERSVDVRLGAWLGDAQPVAVGIVDLDLSPPGLFTRLDIERGGERVDVVDPHIHERVGRRVSRMFGEMQLRALATDADVQRESRSEAVLERDVEAERAIPLTRHGRVGNAQNRDDIGGHGSLPYAGG